MEISESSSSSPSRQIGIDIARVFHGQQPDRYRYRQAQNRCHHHHQRSQHHSRIRPERRVIQTQHDLIRPGLTRQQRCRVVNSNTPAKPQPSPEPDRSPPTTSPRRNVTTCGHRCVHAWFSRSTVGRNPVTLNKRATGRRRFAAPGRAGTTDVGDVRRGTVVVDAQGQVVVAPRSVDVVVGAAVVLDACQALVGSLTHGGRGLLRQQRWWWSSGTWYHRCSSSNSLSLPHGESVVLRQQSWCCGVVASLWWWWVFRGEDSVWNRVNAAGGGVFVDIWRVGPVGSRIASISPELASPASSQINQRSIDVPGVAVINVRNSNGQVSQSGDKSITQHPQRTDWRRLTLRRRAAMRRRRGHHFGLGWWNLITHNKRTTRHSNNLTNAIVIHRHHRRRRRRTNNHRR